MIKYFAFDVETTGTDEAQNEIVEIAYRIIIGKKSIQRHLFLRPTKPENIVPKALEVTGKTKDEIMAYPPREEAWAIIEKDLVENVDLYDNTDKFFVMGYNVEFDLRFLRLLFEAMTRDTNLHFGSFFWYKPNEPRVDPFPLMRIYAIKYLVALPDYKLETVCKYFGINLVNSHNANADLDATIKLCAKFMKAMGEIKING